MEYHLMKKSLLCPKTVLDTVAEQPVDVELNLPDYCPDVERIICCTLLPQIDVEGISGDRLNIEGGACVRILYLDGEKGAVRVYEHTSPFSESLTMGESPSDCAVYVKAKPEYLNCRALSPRKLSLHGAFSLYAKAVKSAPLDYFAYENDDDLQTRGKRMKASYLSGICHESFSVREDISVGSEKEIDTLLSHRLSARITGLKSVEHKIMLSAELKLDLMYLSDRGKREISCFSYSLPVSRVFDCEGVEEQSIIDAELSVMGDDLRLSDDALDGSAVLGLEAKLCFNALCYREEEIEVICDAFSTDREVQTSTAPFSCMSGVICRADTEIGKAAVTVDEGIGKIIDVRCEKLGVTSSVKDGEATLTAKMCAGILFENEDGELRYTERDAEFVTRPQLDDCDSIENSKADVESLSYRLSDNNTIELRAEIGYRMTLCCRSRCTAVTAVSADDDVPVRERDGALILYYTDSHDSVWDIGKRFCSRPADIIAENEIDGDDVGGGVMLLIPTA